jgi:Putative MetA-pathway of phenol degradation
MLVSHVQPFSEEIGDPLTGDPAKPLAPIRVTSPGLTVYKGGAVTPRMYLIEQHLGNLEVTRQMFDVSVSYTPSPRLQLEIEVPFSRTAYDNEISTGSGFGFGNITAWAKYRFFRTVKTYGDRQAALRVGLEMPTGKKTAPTQTQINAPDFVRQQLTPINGGLSPHFDLAFSQAGGRFIFGGNAEVIFRAERDGYRMGHEQRLSTDLEYVIPKDDRKPGGEVFLILETTFVHRGTGRVNGQGVEGSRSTEYYLAPGLQYAALPRFVIEGSFQIPVVRNTGPVVLRTDRNILLGVRYLF